MAGQNQQRQGQQDMNDLDTADRQNSFERGTTGSDTGRDDSMGRAGNNPQESRR